MYSCVKISDKDNVATVTKTICKGETVIYKFKGDEFKVTAVSDIPIYHKMALSDIEKGGIVIKYGCKIGYALEDIKAGGHVHTHNLFSSMD
ncbi:UxaA family hydrolase [Anaerotignum faecicola]|nr:UxaA family hydrolase [Anaerotignum faecicola]